MIRALLILLMLCSTAYAENYSFQSFQNKNFSGVSADKFNGKTIKGSNFYQENKPNSEIFPSGMTGVVFDRCNLDNVKVPPGNTVLPNCTNKKIKVQEDGEDWVLDGKLKPVKKINDVFAIEDEQ